MANHADTVVVMNPRAAAGRAGRVWPDAERRLREALGHFTLRRTEGPGHATTLVRDALKDGAARIISVGGDGTHHEVVNGFFEENGLINPESVLAILPIGTGSDLVRTLGVPRGEQAVRYIQQGDTIRADVGRVTYTRLDGTPGVSHFINVADFGAGGALAEIVGDPLKQFGGFLSFLAGVVRTLASYHPPYMEIEVEGKEIRQKVLTVVAANAEYYGGGIHVAPQARLNDGLLEVYVVNPISFGRGVMNLRRFYTGNVLNRPDLLTYVQARRMTLRSPDRVLINLDGEVPGQLPATVEVVPGAIRLITGSSRL